MTSTVYTKHVSFDDLAPTLIDDEIQALKNSRKHIGFNNQFYHVPPQFNPLYNSGNHNDASNKHVESKQNIKDNAEKLFSFSMAPFDMIKPSASNNDVPFRSRSGSPSGLLQHSPRLPPAPKVSSLKEFTKSVDEQGDIVDYDVADLDLQSENKMNKDTERNTQANSGSRSGYTQSAFANLNELEDRLDSSSTLSLSRTATGTEDKGNRRKSFAGMSDAELAALEDYYAAQSRSTTTPTMERYDFREQDPLFIENMPKRVGTANIDPLAATYPSRPVVDHRAISITTQNAKYEKYVQDLNVKTGSRKPEESLAAIRIVSCYISGRRYTWSSTDWYVENIAQDGDHLVIVTTIPWFEKEVEKSIDVASRRHRSGGYGTEYGRSMSAENVDDRDREFGRVTTSSSDVDTLGANEPMSAGLRIHAIHEEARMKCRNILNYYAVRLQHKIVKITVEMIKEDTPKDAITKAAALYRPDLQIISTVSTNLQIKFKNGNVKLPFFIMRHYAMPTIVVPYEFINPRLLGETVVNLDPLSAKEKKHKDIPKGDERFPWLDSVILKTMKNPFLAENKAENEEDGEGDSESVVSSVNEYFPISPEQKRKIDDFEKIGYVRPPPTHQNLYEDGGLLYDSNGNQLISSSTTPNLSRRSSRIQYNEGIYKVKSLIDNLTDDEYHPLTTTTPEGNTRHYRGSAIRKTKSMGPVTKTTTGHPSLSATTSAKQNRLRLAKNKTADDVASASDQKEKKEKKTKKKEAKNTIGSFFKKVFK